MASMNRRDFIKFAGAGGAVSALGLGGCQTPSVVAPPAATPTPQAPTVAARPAPRRVVIVGGGFGGATCAKYLRLYDNTLEIALVEQNARYVTCPGSNWMLGGMRTLDDLTQSYDALKSRHGVTVITDRVVAVDADKKLVVLASGKALPYDRLVMSPGIDFRWNSIEGYDEAASQTVPHAWKAGPQTQLLQRQLQAMPDGGVFVLAPPPMPFRCPPGPPERASMVAHYFKTHKPRSKILILDAKDNFSKQALFMQAWAQLYPGMIEWVPANAGGQVVRVDPRTRTVTTATGQTHRAAVLNIVPPQRAPQLAADAGLVNDSGWCPVNQHTFESTRVPGIHVIGDASIAGALPKSAHTANNIAKMTAAAIVSIFRGVPPPTPSHVNTCYSLVAPDYGISIAGVYRLGEDGMLQGIRGAGGLSPMDANLQQRAQEAGYAQGWHKSIVADSFG